jgi:hypothetical protein
VSAVPTLDLGQPSRIDGWRNREVLAHLYVQPLLLARFLSTATADTADVDVTANLSGTGAFADLIDASAKEGASMGKVDLGVPVDRVAPILETADLSATITTLQGSISLTGYLVTRCVEAVVHGGDLIPPVVPDRVARTIAADALMDALATTAPELLPDAEQLSEEQWIDVATGRGGPADQVPGLQVMA